MFKNNTQDKKSLRQLRQELKAKKSLEVDIMSLSTGEIFYECPKTRYKFNLNKLGSKESIELDTLTTLVNRSRGFFENHLITIVDFEDDEYTVDDLIEYLGIRDVYDKIENTDTDYIAEILNKDNYDFEKFISTCSNQMIIKRLAERAIYLYSRNEFDSHKKRIILSKAMGMDDIFDVVDAELELREEQLRM